MPFVAPEHRLPEHEPCCVGDRCYWYYLDLITAWNKERRWTTAHNEFKRLFDCDDDQAARALAFFVFFAKKVMPYEDEKASQNGEI